ncbi:MAG: type I-E CRISPR-associated protein Cas5/CasD [Promethearchaeota archaeon]
MNTLKEYIQENSQKSGNNDKENPWFLYFLIEGPLQSWGLRAQWNYRDTWTEPSKSGVIGLIGAAMGIPRNNKRLNELDNALEMAIRVEQPGSILEDFQIVRGAFPKAGGGFHPDDYSQIIHKFYLTDASFWVILKGSKDLLEQIKNALECPKWPYYLGRKSCIPSIPIVPKITNKYSSFDDILGHLPWHPIIPLIKKDRDVYLRIKSKRYIPFKGDLVLKKGDSVVNSISLKCVVEESIDSATNKEDIYLHSLQRQDKIRATPGKLYAIRYVNEYFKDIPVENELNPYNDS